MTASTLTLGAYRSGEYGQATLPRITPSPARYGAIWAHTAGGSCFEGQTAPYAGFIEALAAAGYPTHNGDYSASTYQHGTSFVNEGNADHVAAIGAGFAYLTGTMGAKAGKFYGAGGSMGTIGLLNYAKANLANVGGLLLIVPVLNLLDIYQKTGADIATAYGLAAPITHGSGCGYTNNSMTVTDAASSAAIVGCYVVGTGIPQGTTVASQTTGVGFVLSANATQTLSNQSLTFLAPMSGATLSASSPLVYGAAALSPLPISIWSADDDPIASNTAACQSWASGQSNITVTSMGNVGHTVPTTFDPNRITSFFDANGGRA